MENEFLEGLDALFAVNEAEKAGAYLTEWYQKAVDAGNWRLQVTVLNEMMGYYRSTGVESAALDAVSRMLKLVKDYELEGNKDIGTVWINVGTTLCRFYQYKEGLKYYAMAKEALADCDNPYIMASLYNNSAAAYEAGGNLAAALDNYERSLELLSDMPDCATFMAITYANMANGCHGTGDKEKTGRYVTLMDAVLDNPDIPRDAGYASACVKCASLHFNLGNTERAEELNRRAEEIYQGGIL